MTELEVILSGFAILLDVVVLFVCVVVVMLR